MSFKLKQKNNIVLLILITFKIVIKLQPISKLIIEKKVLLSSKHV